MKRTAFNSTLPVRSEPMSRGNGLSTRTPLSRPREKPAARGRAVGAATGLPKMPGEFTAKVKLQIRTRAGHGDPSQARCEACGRFLGERGGQVHHRAGRGSGGCRDAVIQSLANAALLCGTAFTGCHGRATAFARDLGMDAGGFWIGHGTTPDYDPRNVAILLAGRDGGMRVWLSATEPVYLTADPRAVAA